VSFEIPNVPYCLLHFLRGVYSVILWCQIEVFWKKADFRWEVMSNVKQALKAAKAALDAQDFTEAAAQARTVLESDGKNYFGYGNQARFREL